MKNFKRTVVSTITTLAASAIASQASFSNVTPELYFVNPVAALEGVSYENSGQGTDRSRLNDIKIYDNKIFSVYGSWDNDNAGYVHICSYDMQNNLTDCSYRFGAHGITRIDEINDKLYFMAADPAEYNSVFPYQGLAIYDKNSGWESVSAHNFKDSNGGYVWYAHNGVINAVGDTLYATIRSSSATSTQDKIFKSTDGGLNWRAQSLAHFNNLVNYQGKLYSIDRYGALFDDEKYSYGPWITEAVRANNTYYVEDGNGWKRHDDAPLIFPEYGEFFDLETGYWTHLNPIVFKDKIILNMQKRVMVRNDRGYRLPYDEQALASTDLTRNATEDDIFYRTGLFRFCDGVPINQQYKCQDYLMADILATEQWLYVLLKNGEIRRTSDLKHWEIIATDDDFAQEIITVSIEADDEYVYVGANQGRLYRVKLPKTDPIVEAPESSADLQSIDLMPLAAKSSEFYSWAGSVESTLSDDFAYDVQSPTSVLPEQNFSFYNNNGVYGFEPEGQDVRLAYSLNYLHAGGDFVVDLYGTMNFGQERDNNVSVIMYGPTGNEISRVVNVEIDGDGHARVQFTGIEKNSLITKILVRMHDTAYTFGNFATLMEVRAGGRNLM